MIRHDYIGQQSIAAAVEMLQRALDQAGDAGISHVALTVPDSEQVGESTATLHAVSVPEIVLHLLQGGRWQRIGETKRKHLDHAGHIEVRKIVARTPCTAIHALVLQNPGRRSGIGHTRQPIGLILGA